MGLAPTNREISITSAKPALWCHVCEEPAVDLATRGHIDQLGKTVHHRKCGTPVAPRCPVGAKLRHGYLYGPKGNLIAESDEIDRVLYPLWEDSFDDRC